MGKFVALFGGGRGGGAGGGGIKGAVEAVRPGIAPLRTDKKETEDARKRAIAASLLRKGRRASILTSGSGVTDPLGTVSRPAARSTLSGRVT